MEVVQHIQDLGIRLIHEEEGGERKEEINEWRYSRDR